MIPFFKNNDFNTVSNCRVCVLARQKMNDFIFSYTDIVRFENRKYLLLWCFKIKKKSNRPFLWSWI